MEKRNVVIYVAGQRFSLSTADTEEYVIGIGEKVDTMIKGIQRDNPRFNRDTCATLAALDLCDDEHKLRQMLEVLREQVKDYLRDSENLRAENAKLKEEIKTLKEQLSTADISPEEAVVVSESPAETAEITKPETPEVKPAPTRQTAFAGKEYRPDRKKKRGKHRHSGNNSDNNQTTPPAPPVANPAEDAVLPEDIEFPDTPYQFNIFDTLE